MRESPARREQTHSVDHTSLEVDRHVTRHHPTVDDGGGHSQSLQLTSAHVAEGSHPPLAPVPSGRARCGRSAPGAPRGEGVDDGRDGRVGEAIDDDTVDGPAGDGPDVRTDHLTGATTVVVGSRQGRPNLPADGCPFCVGGLEAPEPYEVRAFPNRWPALGDGRCEVVLYTPDHHQTFWGLGVDGARRVVELWAERTRVLGGRDDVDYVLVFENRGPEVGATIAHPHGQIYAYDRVPPTPLRALLDGVLRPDAVAENLVVGRAGRWVAWVPEAATWPYEVRIAPVDPVGALSDPGCDLDGFARILVDVLARLDQRFDSPMPYMLWIHQRPTDGGEWPDARVCVFVTPFLRAPGTPRFVAAAELGGGIFFNPVVPEAAAAELRELPGART